MIPRFARLAPILIALAAPGFAQRGDRAGEAQKPPPEHLVIPPAPALSVEDAMKTFKVAPGFRVEIVAAEPLVFDPVAMAFGPDGRLWVVEMRGYMPDIEGRGENEPIGSIAVLTDTDGDGRMDKRTVFLDSLVLPRAVSLVDGGALVAEPTHLWYCRDTNGDGVADEKTEIANDYGNTTNPEHNANALYWAMDNWIYSAKHNVRFRYEGDGKFRRENTSARGQWGITQDDMGRLFHNSNSDPLRCDLFPAESLRRNMNITATGANVQIAPPKLEVWPSRVTPGVNRGYRMLREDGTLATVTAACAPLIYRGTLFPAEFAGNAFICEPAANLVKRLLLDEQDGVIKARNAYDKTEFLTSTDERFRPVNLNLGPDGAMYVVDMYRGVIQHRTYVTTYLRKQVEERQLERPVGMGRIYRVLPENARRAGGVNLTTASSASLVISLANQNGWTRDTAQRLLVERRDPAAIPQLRSLATNTRVNPVARLHALWTLDGVGSLDRATVITALNDRDPRVVVTALRMTERWLAPPGDLDLFNRVTALAAEATPVVARQIALSLGEVRTPAGDAALRALALRAGDVPYMPDAIVSGLSGREIEFLEVLAREKGNEKSSKVIALATVAVLKSAKPANVERALNIPSEDLASATAKVAVLQGVRDYLPKSRDGKMFPGNVPAEPKSLVALAAVDSPLGKIAAEMMGFLRWPGKPGAASWAVELTPNEQVLFDKGREQFSMLCAACHQVNGQGMAGLAPSLVNSRWVVGDPRLLARIILNGKTTDNLMMPGLHATLNDEAVAGVMTYIRNTWDHSARAVTPALVAEARAATTQRDEPWNDEDLDELAQELPPLRERRRRQ